MPQAPSRLAVSLGSSAIRQAGVDLSLKRRQVGSFPVFFERAARLAAVERVSRRAPHMFVIDPHVRSITCGSSARWASAGRSPPLPSKARGLKTAAIVLTDWQRNGRAEDVIGIALPLGSDESFDVATIAFRCTVRVACSEQVRVSARKRHRIEGLTSGSSPVVMSLRLELVRPIDERGDNLDEHMVATKAEGRRLHWDACGGALEFVGDDRATRGDGLLHCLAQDVSAGAVEGRKPARLHEHALSIGEVSIECAQ